MLSFGRAFELSYVMLDSYELLEHWTPALSEGEMRGIGSESV